MNILSKNFKKLVGAYKPREVIPNENVLNRKNKTISTSIGEDLFKREYYEDMLGKYFNNFI